MALYNSISEVAVAEDIGKARNGKVQNLDPWWTARNADSADEWDSNEWIGEAESREVVAWRKVDGGKAVAAAVDNGEF
jgi:hypothetical protein